AVPVILVVIRLVNLYSPAVVDLQSIFGKRQPYNGKIVVQAIVVWRDDVGKENVFRGAIRVIYSYAAALALQAKRIGKFSGIDSGFAYGVLLCYAAILPQITVAFWQ